MTGSFGAAGAEASWFGGSIHPDAGHWRQYHDAAGAFGHKQGNNVTEMGRFEFSQAALQIGSPPCFFDPSSPGLAMAAQSPQS